MMLHSAPMLFSHLLAAPADPILGQTEAFLRDPRPHKINLGVGMYFDDAGRVPTLPSVAAAAARLAAGTDSNGYLPIDGLPAFCTAARAMLFAQVPDSVREHIVTVQTLGGTGALMLAAELLASVHPCARVLISEPSWENHRAIFEAAGFSVGTYPYFDAENCAVAFEDMLATLCTAAPGTIVVLHATCHNPTGCDLTSEEWQTIAAVCADRRLVAMVDAAYHGFGMGLTEDVDCLRAFLANNCSLLVASSFSKNFSMYRQRVGALSVACHDGDEASRVRSQLKRMIRARYSNPPAHGAQLVSTVLSDALLKVQWEQELTAMRLRIREMREQLQRLLMEAGVTRDTTYLTHQRGMFSYTGLPQPAMRHLREVSAVYGLDTGRICVAALNSRNLDTVARAIAEVMR